jgi:wobble nucleotide-excising tRNase
MDDIVTENWADFGYIEIEEAKKLLSHIGEIESTGQVKVAFNRNSGCVFLYDEDYRTWMMNGELIEEWFNCPYCGHEGFLEDMKHEPKDRTCEEYMKQIGVE